MNSKQDIYLQELSLPEDRAMNLDVQPRGINSLGHNASILRYSTVDSTTEAEDVLQATLMLENLFCNEPGPLRPPFVTTSTY